MKKTSKLYFLNKYITNKNIEVGDYTYFYSFNNKQGVIEFQNRNVLYHFPEIYKDKLIIGKFCAIADETKFLMNGANHRINSLSTYPFEMFNEFKINNKFNYISKGDTIIGHDVWIGYRSTIMPGIKIGTGSIIAANSVVTKNIPEYSIVGGNPAKVIRKRFDQNTINKLLRLEWWNLEVEEIKK